MIHCNLNCYYELLTIFNILNISFSKLQSNGDGDAHSTPKDFSPARSIMDMRHTALNVLKDDGLSKLSEEVKNGTCSLLESSNFSLCPNSIEDCNDTPNNNVVSTGIFGFVIVLKGANSTGNIHNRVVVMNVDVP